jgi:chromosome segregation ATPase
MFSKRLFSDALLQSVVDILTEGNTDVKEKVKKKKEMIQLLRGHLKDYDGLFKGEMTDGSGLEKGYENQQKLVDKAKTMLTREESKLSEIEVKLQEIRQRAADHEAKKNELLSKIDAIQNEINELQPKEEKEEKVEKEEEKPEEKKEAKEEKKEKEDKEEDELKKDLEENLEIVK